MIRFIQVAMSVLALLLLLPIVFPIALVMKLGWSLGLLKSSTDFPANYVETNILNLLEDRDGEWDWADFTEIPIANPALDDIRWEAQKIRFPLTEDGRAKLSELVLRARAIGQADEAQR